MRKKTEGGLIYLLLVAGFYIYKNRETIHKHLKGMGIDLPEILRNQASRVREGVEYARKAVQGR